MQLNLKNELGKISMMKIGVLISGIGLAVQQSGIDFCFGDLDKKIISLVIIVGGMIAGNGMRDAISKTKAGK